MNKNNQNGKSWDRGVSRKYYEDLRGRVEEIALAVNRGNAGQIMDQVMGYVDAYLENPSAPFEPDSRSSNESDIIFLTLREDIARAVERSRRAKARAASRRKVKAAEPVEVTARREPGKRTKPGEIAAPVNYTDVSVSAVQQSEPRVNLAPHPQVAPRKSIRIAGRTLKLRKVTPVKKSSGCVALRK